MNKYFIYLHDSQTLVGILIINNQENNKKTSGCFYYSEDYLNNSTSFSLDPINLPLNSKGYLFKSPYDKVGAIFDFFPDNWGRAVLNSYISYKPENISNKLSDEKLIDLISLNSNSKKISLGAFFIRKEKHQHLIKNSFKFKEAIKAKNSKNIAKYKKLLSGIDIHPESFWHIGGARPKMHIKLNDDYWIAKFNPEVNSEQKDCNQINFAKLEFLFAKFAKLKIGLNVPETNFLIINNEPIFLIKRFDFIKGKRHHLISALSLISPPPDFKIKDLDAELGQEYFSYKKVAQIIKKISANPISDLIELYKRMVLNVFLSNTDDHLKNHAFVFDTDKREYRLSPLYNVNMQFNNNTKHMLHIGDEGRASTISNCLSAAKHFGIKQDVAIKIIEKISNEINEIHLFSKSLNLNINDSIEDIKKITQPKIEEAQKLVSEFKNQKQKQLYEKQIKVKL